VLGSGPAGRGLASRLAGLGYDVAIGTRDPAATLAQEQTAGEPFAAWHARHPGVPVLTFAGAARPAALVVNATAGDRSLAALAMAGEESLAGKVLLDLANPLQASADGAPPTLDPVSTDSLGEQIQRAYPRTRVVKALNMINWDVMVDPGRVPGEHTVFICGDDGTAKAVVTDLLRSFGWPPRSAIDLGDITASRGMEMLWPLWLSLVRTFGHANLNFHVQHAAPPPP
jgi:predicted dinucleotide-binding enzyme